MREGGEMAGRSRVVVGISGASGAVLGVRVVERLAALGACEIHLVISAAGRRTLLHEMGEGALEHLGRLVHARHPDTAIGAAVASGSFRTQGMIVAPCSMHTLAAIAYTQSSTLLLRAADVHLKERRPLVLLTREAPLHLGHLRAMVAASELGAIICPPVPAWYLKPASLAEVECEIAARAVGLLGLPGGPREWGGLPEEEERGEGKEWREEGDPQDFLRF
jgi:4-hydroxy-3-polyprenylbenzoate decarboxylase